MTVQKDYSVYPTEYFSGSDVYIFFNNKMIDQIISIQFNLNENIVPIYGYASYTHDAVARGTRIVHGSFRINFVENMYLYTLMEDISEEVYTPSTLKSSIANNLTAEDITHAIKHGNLSKIKDEINENEDRLWSSRTEDSINKYRTPYFTGNTSSKIKKEGFDIVISYGDEKFTEGYLLEEVPSTVKVINGVHLTGVNQVVQPTGEAIFEEYTFIAKDLDNTISLRK
jgi:hypothetical protein